MTFPICLTNNLVYFNNQKNQSISFGCVFRFKKTWVQNSVRSIPREYKIHPTHPNNNVYTKNKQYWFIKPD